MSAISKMKLDTLFSNDPHIQIISSTPEDTCRALTELYPDAYEFHSSAILDLRETRPEMMKDIDVYHYLLSKKMLILSLTDDDLKKDELWKLILFILHTRKYELPEKEQKNFRAVIVTATRQIYNIPTILLGNPVQVSSLFAES